MNKLNYIFIITVIVQCLCKWSDPKVKSKCIIWKLCLKAMLLYRLQWTSSMLEQKVITTRCFQIFINHLWIYQLIAKNLKILTCNKQFTELSFRIPNKCIPGTVKFKFLGDLFNQSPKLNHWSVRGERYYWKCQYTKEMLMGKKSFEN